jgi:hypothetical protein
MANPSTASFYGSNPTPTEGVALEQLVAQATSSANLALVKAESADQSAVEAVASANNAAASASSASTAAALADSRATAASSSATSASTSATNASNSASSAATSATNAASSAAAVAAGVADATSAAGTAITKAAEASTSASNAATSASTATTKAGEAAASATSASGSATTATTKAGEASTSAATATTKAWGGFAASATTATTKAGEASTSASAAAGSASAAATSASNAATSASNAAASAAAADGYPLVLLDQGQIPAGSSVATVDIYVQDEDVNAFELVFEYFLPVTDGSSLYARFSTDYGTTYNATGYVWAMRLTDSAATPLDQAQAGVTTEMRLILNQGSGTQFSGASGVLKFWQPPNGTSIHVPVLLQSTSVTSTTTRRIFAGGGTANVGAGKRITNIRLFASAGNIKQLAYRLYGIKNVIGV